MDRRHFLETLAVGLITAGCAVPVRTSAPVARIVDAENDEDDLRPLARFFVTAITAFAPDIDVTTDRLSFAGTVDRPYQVTYDALSEGPQTSFRSVLQCVGGAKGNAEWVGTRLRDHLLKADIQPEARKVVFIAADGYESSIPVEVALRDDSLLAHTMNGEPLQRNHGAPIRLVLPGIYGYKQVKWITRIVVVAGNHKGYWEQRGYSDDGTIRT